MEGDIDLSNLAGKGVFTLWNDYSAFQKVYIGKSGEIAWSDKIDLCIEKKLNSKFVTMRKLKIRLACTLSASFQKFL